MSEEGATAAADLPGAGPAAGGDLEPVAATWEAEGTAGATEADGDAVMLGTQGLNDQALQGEGADAVDAGPPDAGPEVDEVPGLGAEGGPHSGGRTSGEQPGGIDGDPPSPPPGDLPHEPPGRPPKKGPDAGGGGRRDSDLQRFLRGGGQPHRDAHDHAAESGARYREDFSEWRRSLQSQEATAALNRKALQERRLQSPGIDGVLARRDLRISRPDRAG